MAKRKRTAFVPRLVFRIAMAGVVPACVAACGSSGGGGNHDLAHGDRFFSVADQFFSVAAPQDLSTPPDAAVDGDSDGGRDQFFAVADQFFSVAAPIDFAVPPPQKG